jgi:dUTP pyrophosphatase
MSNEIEVEVEEPWIRRVLEEAAARYPAIRIRLLRETAQVPRYMSAGAAGADVFADVRGAIGQDFMIVQGGTTAKIPLGVAFEIPEGMVGLLKGRSGLALRGHEAHVAAIDSDYRGEVHMLLHAAHQLRIEHGERVGQILFMPVAQASFELVDQLGDTERGDGGFGSTGVR